ncbi:PREDICTED: homeobox protein cut-like 1 [Cercocebus atys]|uniref:homeobox protein cut-like 1 n=1 Tax=Cercocebus atys TaxID=9531 RepID=UPI0005F4ED15|nr:PREDICTED: homeobox protein cut-like 1 [Cercocebus atys]
MGLEYCNYCQQFKDKNCHVGSELQERHGSPWAKHLLRARAAPGAKGPSDRLKLLAQGPRPRPRSPSRALGSIPSPPIGPGSAQGRRPGGGSESGARRQDSHCQPRSQTRGCPPLSRHGRGRLPGHQGLLAEVPGAPLRGPQGHRRADQRRGCSSRCVERPGWRISSRFGTPHCTRMERGWAPSPRPR